MILALLACRAPSPAIDHASVLPGSDVVRFIAVGDTGKANATQHAVSQGIAAVCASRGCDFALLLGDNLYPRGMRSVADPRMHAAFTDVYGHLDLDFYAALGNHDYGNAGEVLPALYQRAWAERTPRYHLPDRYYRFRYGSVEFWALDTDAVFWTGLQPQSDWLDRTLAASTAETKIVFGHHPYRSNARHGNAGSYEGWSGLPYSSGTVLRTLFESHVVGKADLYVAGHDHNLQLLEHKGLDLIVSGAGADKRPLVDRGNDLELGFAVPGFAWVEVSDTIQVAFFDASGTLLGEQNLAQTPAIRE